MRLTILSLLLLATSAHPQIRPIHTYSIVAHDPQTNQLGVAVQSHWFSVGTIVSWAEAGVGAVATQSLAEISYGPLGLDMMRAGKSATEALQGLVASDSLSAVRQVAMVDAQGLVASHTGTKCIAEAGYRIGPHYSVQANIMLKDTVWDAMAKAYENATGDLAERMLQALEAAEAEGGDLRGRQSAALLIVSGEPTGIPWQDRLFDLQIADHPTPLKELRRLVKVARAYHHMDQGDEYLGLNEMDQAMTEYKAAAELVPDSVEMRFWHAATLASVDQVAASLPIFARVFKEEPVWRKIIPRLVKAELLPPEVVDEILAVE